MTPEQKIKELVDKFKEINKQYVLNGMANEADVNDEAKECALLLVDEVVIALKFTNDSKHYADQHNYWQSIKECFV